MRGAKGILISITGGVDLTLYEVDAAANRIREEVDADVNLIFGSTFDERLQGQIRVSVVATGIDGVKNQPGDASSSKRQDEPPIPLSTQPHAQDAQSMEGADANLHAEGAATSFDESQSTQAHNLEGGIASPLGEKQGNLFAQKAGFGEESFEDHGMERRGDNASVLQDDLGVTESQGSGYFGEEGDREVLSDQSQTALQERQGNQVHQGHDRDAYRGGQGMSQKKLGLFQRLFGRSKETEASFKNLEGMERSVPSLGRKDAHLHKASDSGQWEQNEAQHASNTRPQAIGSEFLGDDEDGDAAPYGLTPIEEEVLGSRAFPSRAQEGSKTQVAAVLNSANKEGAGKGADAAPGILSGESSADPFGDDDFDIPDFSQPRRTHG